MDNQQTIIDPKFTGLPPGVPLNPAQVEVVPYMDRTDVNLLVAWHTGAGKSTVINMVGQKYIEAGDRVVYIGIMRALAQEKADDWNRKGHPWKGTHKTVISGDYRMNKDKEREIEQAQLISITPESLASRLRHPNSERNRWLGETKLLVVDEIHLLTAPDRGTHMEAALMEFTQEFPDVQLVGLSGTVPNFKELAAWMTKLNGKETIILHSEYRPVPIEWHWKEFDPGYSREESEENRIDLICELIKSKPHEQWMVAVWQKVFGNKVKDALRSYGIRAEFHNANHDRAERARLENGFREGLIPVMISTSTLFTGVNLPSPNMIISATEINRSFIPAYEIQQAAGRAGRVAYNTEGHVYVLVTPRNHKTHKDRIIRGEPVESNMHVVPYLATHFLGAIYLERVQNNQDFVDWFDRTLAQMQQKMPETNKLALLQQVMHGMVKRRMVVQDAYNGSIRLTHRGKIAAQMYFDPFHLFDAIMNLHKYAALANPSDLALAIAIGTCAAYRMPNPSKIERDACLDEVLNNVAEEYAKAVSVILYRIRKQAVPPPLSNANFVVIEDMSRLHAACLRAHDECEHFDMTTERLNTMFVRIIRKCSAEEADLSMKSFTPKERKALFSLGLYSYSEVRDNVELASTVMPRERLIAMNLLSKNGAARKRAFGGR